MFTCISKWSTKRLLWLLSTLTLLWKQFYDGGIGGKWEMIEVHLREDHCLRGIAVLRISVEIHGDSQLNRMLCHVWRTVEVLIRLKKMLVWDTCRYRIYVCTHVATIVDKHDNKISFRFAIGFAHSRMSYYETVLRTMPFVPCRDTSTTGGDPCNRHYSGEWLAIYHDGTNWRQCCLYNLLIVVEDKWVDGNGNNLPMIVSLCIVLMEWTAKGIGQMIKTQVCIFIIIVIILLFFCF